MPNELFVSQDGSHSLISDKFGVSYHSKYGAIAESQHVFIEAGLKYQLNRGKQTLKVLEMGFGTGLNALMTYQFTLNNTLKIDYHTFEKYPILLELSDELNYTEQLDANHLKQDFKKMHAASSISTISLTDKFKFTKYIEDILTAELPSSLDVIYYDAFAPNAQVELWEEGILSKLFQALSPQGILTTYCAKGSFKRAMKSVGFTLDSIPGPHGKREMTRGIKNI